MGFLVEIRSGAVPMALAQQCQTIHLFSSIAKVMKQLC